MEEAWIQVHGHEETLRTGKCPYKLSVGVCVCRVHGNCLAPLKQVTQTIVFLNLGPV